jgi:hypothetical protein
LRRRGGLSLFLFLTFEAFFGQVLDRAPVKESQAQVINQAFVVFGFVDVTTPENK